MAVGLEDGDSDVVRVVVADMVTVGVREDDADGDCETDSENVTVLVVEYDGLGREMVTDGVMEGSVTVTVDVVLAE